MADLQTLLTRPGVACTDLGRADPGRWGEELLFTTEYRPLVTLRRGEEFSHGGAGGDAAFNTRQRQENGRSVGCCGFSDRIWTGGGPADVGAGGAIETMKSTPISPLTFWSTIRAMAAKAAAAKSAARAASPERPARRRMPAKVASLGADAESAAI
jgi:hypothetical protein